MAIGHDCRRKALKEDEGEGEEDEEVGEVGKGPLEEHVTEREDPWLPNLNLPCLQLFL